MVTIQIGDSRQELEYRKDVKVQWIHEQILNRRNAGETVCVQVLVDPPAGGLRLSTPACPRGGGSRNLTSQEEDLRESWDKLGLNESNFKSKDVVDFLRSVLR